MGFSGDVEGGGKTAYDVLPPKPWKAAPQNYDQIFAKGEYQPLDCFCDKRENPSSIHATVQTFIERLETD